MSGKDSVLAGSSLDSGSIVLILIIVITVLVILLSAVLYKYYEQKKSIHQIVKNLGEYMDGGHQSKMLLMVHDREIRKLLNYLNQLIEIQKDLKARQVKQEQSSRKMLSNISHDLKTPLTVIMGYVELLLREVQETNLADSQIQQGLVPKENSPTFIKLTKVMDKTQEVLMMVETFFDVVKLESGEYQLNIETIDLCEVSREEILNCYQLLEQAQMAVEVVIPEQQILVRGDVMAIKRSLSNLLQNAIRYGSDGRYLKLCVYRNGDYCCIDVIDHGKGIVEESQEKVFERLYTLEDSRNKKYQGSGLGLTITKRLVESMNGVLELQSVPYEETRFTIKLPAKSI